ncbi:MAG: hypothetical protein U0172_14850 [Nitrospiraceae bacterium]
MPTPGDESAGANGSAASREGVSQLTVRALEAAERGRWDEVEACYQAREAWFRDNPVSPNLARALLAMDQAVMERVSAAQAATGQALTQALTVHRQWRTISASIVEPTTAIGRRLDAST